MTFFSAKMAAEGVSKFAMSGQSGVINYHELEDVCKCSVCLEPYKDPKVLPCEHCFCKECLELLLKVPVQDGIIWFGGDVKIDCPCCRTVTTFGNGKTLSALKGNLQLVPVLDLLQKMSLKQPAARTITRQVMSAMENCSTSGCSNSLENPVEWKRFVCVPCKTSNCSACFKDWVHIYAMSLIPEDHTVLVSKLNRDGEISFHCKDHDLAVKYFCNQCKRVACADCCLLYHRTHEIKTVATIANMAREDLRPHVNEARRKIQMMDGLSSDYEQYFSNINSCNEETVVGEISDRKKEIIDYVNQILNSAEENLLKLWRERKNTLINEVTVEKGKLQTARAAGETIVQMADKIIQRDLEVITHSSHQKANLNLISMSTAKTFSTSCLNYQPYFHSDGRSGQEDHWRRMARKHLERGMGAIGPFGMSLFTFFIGKQLNLYIISLPLHLKLKPSPSVKSTVAPNCEFNVYNDN